jgi:hypothetical protein
LSGWVAGPPTPSARSKCGSMTATRPRWWLDSTRRQLGRSVPLKHQLRTGAVRARPARTDAPPWTGRLCRTRARRRPDWLPGPAAGRPHLNRLQVRDGGAIGRTLHGPAPSSSSCSVHGSALVSARTLMSDVMPSQPTPSAFLLGSRPARQRHHQHDLRARVCGVSRVGSHDLGWGGLLWGLLQYRKRD